MPKFRVWLSAKQWNDKFVLIICDSNIFTKHITPSGSNTSLYSHTVIETFSSRLVPFFKMINKNLRNTLKLRMFYRTSCFTTLKIVRVHLSQSRHARQVTHIKRTPLSRDQQVTPIYRNQAKRVISTLAALIMNFRGVYEDFLLLLSKLWQQSLEID